MFKHKPGIRSDLLLFVLVSILAFIYGTKVLPCVHYYWLLLPDGVKSEVLLFYPCVAYAFLNTNKMHPLFYNDSDCCESRVVRYAGTLMSCSGDCVIKNGQHSTGWYTIHVYSKPPPRPPSPHSLHIFDSEAKYKKKYNINPRVCIGLPEVFGKFWLTDYNLSVHHGSKCLNPLEYMASLSCVSFRTMGQHEW